MSSLDQWRATKRFAKSSSWRINRAEHVRGMRRYHVFPALELSEIWKGEGKGHFVFHCSLHLALGEHLQGAFQWIREKKNTRVIKLVLGFRDCIVR